MVATQSAAACEGLAKFFFDYGDTMIQRYQQLNFWFAEHDLDLYSVVDRLIQRMCQEDRAASLAVLQKNCVEWKAWSWIAGYVQHIMWKMGWSVMNQR